MGTFLRHSVHTPETQKNTKTARANKQSTAWFSAPFTTSGQETEWALFLQVTATEPTRGYPFRQKCLELALKLLTVKMGERRWYDVNSRQTGQRKQRHVGRKLKVHSEECIVANEWQNEVDDVLACPRQVCRATKELPPYQAMHTFEDHRTQLEHVTAWYVQPTMST